MARVTALEMFVQLRIAAEQGERVQNVYLAPKISYHGLYMDPDDFDWHFMKG